MAPAAQLSSGAGRTLAGFAQRFGYLLRSGAWWMAVGCAASVAWSLPLLVPVLERYGVAAWLVRGTLPVVATAFILLAGFTVALGSGTVEQLLQRRARAVLLMSVCAALGAAVQWAVDSLFPVASALSLAARLMNWWLNVIVFGGAFGLMVVSNLRRLEDQARLTSLQSQRAVLERALAESRLVRARAQIDPLAVASVLREVRLRYGCDADAAPALLDALIAYLRVAMQRRRGRQASMADEFELLAAYADLRSKQAGVSITLAAPDHRMAEQAMAGFPVFQVAKAMLDELIGAHARAARLRMVDQGGKPAAVLEVDGAAVDDAAMEKCRCRLQQLPGAADGLTTLRRTSDLTGVRYVVGG